MKTKTIKQTVRFRAAPVEVYELLMDSEKHSTFTQSECLIGQKVGEKFSAYGGYCEGENLELVPSRRIAQRWRASDWPAGHYSKIVFDFKKTKDGCELAFTQSGVPYEFAEEISGGWREHYWRRMSAMLGK